MTASGFTRLISFSAASGTSNAPGARTDGQSTNERQYSADWNPVWNLRAARFEGGWSIEAALPFKSLRYRAGRTQVWGFQARRTNKWKNEIAYLTRVPPAFGIGRGSFAASLFATMVGIEAPDAGRLVHYPTPKKAPPTTAMKRYSMPACALNGVGVTARWK